MTHPQLLTPDEERELVSLWPKRADALERVWELVTKVLRRITPSILRSLPDEKDEYIASFFDQKILSHLHKPQQLDRAASLCSWFNNFLLDQEARKSNKNESLDEMLEESGDTCLLDLAASAITPESMSETQQLRVLASQFFNSLEWEDRLYLSENHCPDEGEALSTLAKRYKIASYHYRAGKLGITLKKGDIPVNWGGTLIGRWIKQTLGIPILADSLHDIHQALKALCEIALALRDTPVVTDRQG